MTMFVAVHLHTVIVLLLMLVMAVISGFTLGLAYARSKLSISRLLTLAVCSIFIIFCLIIFF